MVRSDVVAKACFAATPVHAVIRRGSDSCSADTVVGASGHGSEALLVLGKAMTSRMCGLASEDGHQAIYACADAARGGGASVLEGLQQWPKRRWASSGLMPSMAKTFSLAPHGGGYGPSH